MWLLKLVQADIKIFQKKCESGITSNLSGRFFDPSNYFSCSEYFSTFKPYSSRFSFHLKPTLHNTFIDALFSGKTMPTTCSRKLSEIPFSSTIEAASVAMPLPQQPGKKR